jgi:hypothetical protein
MISVFKALVNIKAFSRFLSSFYRDFSEFVPVISTKNLITRSHLAAKESSISTLAVYIVILSNIVVHI